MEDIAPSDTEYVTIVSGDGFEHILNRDIAYVSPVVENIFENTMMRESHTGICTFPEISGVVLEVIIKWMIYYYRSLTGDEVHPPEIPVYLCLELMVASDYLGLNTTNLKGKYGN